MLALIDADLVAYRCAASCKEEDPLDVALYRIDVLMRQILEAADCSEYIAYLSGSDNFRKVINPEYKANRKDMVPPIHLQPSREFLVSEWNARLAHGIEADDMLGIDQTEDSVICSLDKDLLMIPGKHHNWNKQIYQEYTHVSVTEGNKTFWKQMLIGDTSDNIIGVHGLGPVKAGKLIDPCESNEECMELVYNKYAEDAARFVTNANCLWIMRHWESTWSKDLGLTLPSPLLQEQEAQLKSITSTRDLTSMEPTM